MLLKSWWLQMELKVDPVSISSHVQWEKFSINKGCMSCVNMNCIPWKPFVLAFEHGRDMWPRHQNC